MLTGVPLATAPVRLCPTSTLVSDTNIRPTQPKVELVIYASETLLTHFHATGVTSQLHYSWQPTNGVTFHVAFFLESCRRGDREGRRPDSEGDDRAGHDDAHRRQR